MDRIRQFVRYGTVSIVATATSLTVLAFLVSTRAVGAGWANVVAVAAGTIPSFELNRRWVWSKGGKRSLLREVAPFCALSFTGLVLSTGSVHFAAAWADRVGMGGLDRTLVVEAAHLAAWGALWIAQFVILDRFLFGQQADRFVVVHRAEPVAPARSGSAETVDAA